MPRKSVQPKNPPVEPTISPEPAPMSPPVLERQPTNKIIGKPKKKNDWIDHVKSYADKHGISYRESLSQSKASYKKDQ